MCRGVLFYSTIDTAGLIGKTTACEGAAFADFLLFFGGGGGGGGGA